MRTPWIIAAALLALGLTHCRTTSSDGDSDADADGDADGDADSDGDADGDQDDDDDGEPDADQDVTPCFPRSGAACDPVDNCGCAAGEFCDIAVTAEAEMVETCTVGEGGSADHGDECGEGCAPGNVCLGDGLCYHWCLAEEDCSERYLGSNCSQSLTVGDPPVPLEPYQICSPEDEALGVGEAAFSVCTGRLGDCPGNTPFPYSMSSGTTGRCSFQAGSPMALTFALYDTAQSLSVTGNDLRFEPSGEDLVVAVMGDATRFSIQLPDLRNFSTRNLASPPTDDSCEVRIRYRPAAGDEDPAFDMEFTCNNIDVNATDDRLVTIADEGMGPGTVSMSGCAITE